MKFRNVGFWDAVCVVKGILEKCDYRGCVMRCRVTLESGGGGGASLLSFCVAGGVTGSQSARLCEINDGRKCGGRLVHKTQWKARSARVGDVPKISGGGNW